jgi:hypothetical protein
MAMAEMGGGQLPSTFAGRSPPEIGAAGMLRPYQDTERPRRSAQSERAEIV